MLCSTDCETFKVQARVKRDSKKKKTKNTQLHRRAKEALVFGTKSETFFAENTGKKGFIFTAHKKITNIKHPHSTVFGRVLHFVRVSRCISVCVCVCVNVSCESSAQNGTSWSVRRRDKVRRLRETVLGK